MKPAATKGITRQMPNDAPPPTLRQEVETALPALRSATWVALTGGRTNQVWRVGDLVVKRSVPGAESPLFPNDPLAEAAALRLVAPHGLAPALRHTGHGWLAYDHSAGQPWQGGDPGPVAAVLAAVHALPAAPFRQVGSGSAALLQQARGILAQCDGALPPPPEIPDVPPIMSRLIHGDAVAGNVVVGAAGVRLIDWQCPAMGDPAEDLAAFLSPAMQWLYRGEILTAEQEAAFLAAYSDSEVSQRFRALKPLFRWRMAAHCLWKAARGDAEYRAALALELA